MDCAQTVAYPHDDMSIGSTTTVTIVCKRATPVTTFYGPTESRNDIYLLIIQTLTQTEAIILYKRQNGFSNIQGMAQGKREHQTQL